VTALDETFAELTERLSTPTLLDAKRSDPVFYFVFDPGQALEVKSRVPLWAARLREDDGWVVSALSLSRIAREIIDRSGHWNEWVTHEANFDAEQINASISDVLSQALIDRLVPYLTTPSPSSLYFLTDVEMLHPYFRIHALESQLHDRIKVPAVIFYPGRRSGASGLSFLGIYPVDGSYRSTLIGGVL